MAIYQTQKKVLLRVEEVAEQLDIGRSTAYALIRSGRIRSVKIGRLRRIPVEAVAEAVSRLEQGEDL